MKDWKREELKSIDLGDARLNQRSKQILQKFSDAPSSSINKAFQGWYEIKAAYRFFDNENVSPEKILAPHKEASISRIKDDDSKIILCVQDTTILDYTHRQKRVEGLGKIRKDHEQGFLLHPTVAFTPNNICLGALNYKTWAREELKGKIARREVRPVEEKESMRWIESYMATDALALDYSDKLFINIADREADFYELLEQYDKNTSLAHMIIRAKSDRVVDYESHDQNRKLWHKLAGQPSVGQIEFEIDAIPKKKSGKKSAGNYKDL